MKHLIALIAALALLACGGGGGGNSPSEPGAPNVTGTYSSATFWRLQLTRQSDGAQLFQLCPGSLTIASQAGSSFAGSFTMLASSTCSPSSGSVVNGSVRGDAGVSFGLAFPGQDPNNLYALTGCTRASGDSLLNGSAAGGVLQASAVAVLNCPPPSNTVRVDLAVSGSR
jgi:hypothetical protein